MIAELCELGDAAIERIAAEVYNSKHADRGVAFPTCVNVGDVLCHFSPLLADEGVPTLAVGDLVKVQLGAHCEGFSALVTHTAVVPNEDGTPVEVTGRAADVLHAAWAGAEIALRLTKAGAHSAEVTAALHRVAEAYEVTPVQDAMMYQLRRYVLHGDKVVAVRAPPGATMEDCEFEVGEVFNLDVCMSTGDGIPKATGDRSTVYKREPEIHVGLKTRAGKWFIKQVSENYPALPFCLRALGNDVQARMGASEAYKQDLLLEFPVFRDKGATLAQFGFTALLLPGGTMKGTGNTLSEHIKSDKKLPDDLAELLTKTTYKPKSRRRRAKK